ncbi:hypothetical protein DPMN_144373 [Dreissena polymorpha]|uniref:Uncharacterized protein n=1 Tax=Dreissena polymorpha TaxID=45954 RepID=A0A9D4JKW8_DREPO|nr:hypothetical protein DPMN_144373 [Dreissena polymorpha]
MQTSQLFPYLQTHIRLGQQPLNRDREDNPKRGALGSPICTYQYMKYFLVRSRGNLVTSLGRKRQILATRALPRKIIKTLW